MLSPLRPRPARTALHWAVPAVLLSLSACRSADSPDPRVQPPLVRTGVAGALAQSSMSFSGTVVAQVQSDLSFRVTGKVVQRLVDAGQVVRKGAVLMRLDPTDLQWALQSQEAALSAARSRAVQAAADELRFDALVATGAVSVSARDQARAAADTARDQVKGAEAQARVAASNVGYAVLLADTDGVVTETLSEPGQVVNAGQPVLRLARSGLREALVHVPEGLQSSLPPIATARVHGAPAAEAAPAKLRLLSGAANPATRTFEARYVLSGPAARVAIGSTVTLDLPDGRTPARLSVPLASLYDKGQGPGVWVLDRAKASVSWRAVKVAAVDEETASLSSGLAAGEHFVSLGAHQLHEGQAVRERSTP